MKYRNEIVLGNAYELIKTLADKSIDLIVTDPPYEYVTGGRGGSFRNKNRKYHDEYNSIAFNESFVRNYKPGNQWFKTGTAGFDYSILDEFDRVMKEINIYIWCSKRQLSSLLNHYEKKNCNVDVIVWQKTNPIPTINNSYLSDVEYCVFARSPGVRLYGNIETKRHVYTTTTNKEDKNDYKHPTIKPLHIIHNLITNSSKPNDLILDPFMGSGTTAVAAQESGRNFVGFEIDPKFHKIATDRIEGINARGQTSLSLFSKETNDEIQTTIA